MKPNRTTITSALLKTLAAVCALAAASASAADATWTNNASSTWITAANWDPNAAPGAASPGTTSADTATFYTTPLTASRTVTVDTGRNVRNILFTNSTTTFGLILSSGSLVLSSGGKIELTSSALANTTTTVNPPITLQGSYTFLNNAGTASPTVNLLDIKGNISGAASLGAITLTLGGTAGGVTTGGKAILQTGVISDGTGNTLSIVKQDAGAWQLNGVNTFSGGVTVKQGALVIGNNGGLSSGGTGAVTLGDNATGQDASISVGSSITVNNPITVASGSGIRMLANNGGSGNGTYSGVITLNHDLMLGNLSGNGARTLNFSGAFAGTGNLIITNAGVAAGNRANLTGAVTNNGTISNVSLLGDVFITGAIGTNVSGVVQASTTSTMTLSSPANAYTGSTLINQGTLLLGASGSIASSTNINVAAGATFDVSAVTGGFSLANGQTLQGAGTVNGGVAGVTGSKIFPAGSGTAGTLTFNNNLNMSGGGTNLLDVSTSAAGGNDAISVGGTLTAGGVLRLSALSGAANLDTNADYVLITAASISGSFASTPVWVGTQPANAANYTIVTSGTQVTLHYNSSVPPTVTATASPSTVTRGHLLTITALATPGSLAPGSAISSVVVDLSSIGLSSTSGLVQSNSSTIWTNTFIVGGASTPGNVSTTVTVTDASAFQGFFGLSFTVLVELEKWNGLGANDNWGTPLNWTNGVSPVSGDLVSFDGSTRTTPNLEAGYNVAGVTFNSGAASFNIGTANSSTLTVTGGLTNNSANTQTLTAPLALSGTNVINAAAGNITLAGAISDGGLGFLKTGSSNLTLSAVNTYTGPTVITNGTLTISGSGTLGGGSADVTVAGATSALNLGGSSQSVGVMTVAGGSVAGGTVTASSYALQGGTVSANLAGSGVAAAKTTTNTLVLTGNNTFDGGLSFAFTSAGLCVNSATALGTGTFNPSLGGNGGSFDCTAPTAISNANNNAISINGNFTFVGSQSLNLGTGAANMGSLAKTITVLSNSLEIGGGIFNTSGSSTLTKAGEGKLILSGASTYTGATAVSGGVLLLTGSIGSANPVTVNTNATLAGTGSVGGALVINAGGTVSPGASIGTLTVANNVTVNGTLAVEVNRSGFQSDLIAAGGAAAYGGTLSVTNLGAALQSGDAFTLVTASGHSGSFTNIIGSPGAGLAYSFTNGVLSVVATVATNPTNITSTVSGGTLQLSWPADHTGWALQVQTNTRAIGLTTNWVDVPGSTSTNGASIPLDPANGAVFYRLKY